MKIEEKGCGYGSFLDISDSLDAEYGLYIHIELYSYPYYGDGKELNGSVTLNAEQEEKLLDLLKARKEARNA